MDSTQWRRLIAGVNLISSEIFWSLISENLPFRMRKQFFIIASLSTSSKIQIFYEWTKWSLSIGWLQKTEHFVCEKAIMWFSLYKFTMFISSLQRKGNQHGLVDGDGTTWQTRSTNGCIESNQCGEIELDRTQEQRQCTNHVVHSDVPDGR